MKLVILDNFNFLEVQYRDFRDLEKNFLSFSFFLSHSVL